MYHPVFLAASVVNKALGGDLLTTEIIGSVLTLPMKKKKESYPKLDLCAAGTGALIGAKERKSLALGFKQGFSNVETLSKDERQAVAEGLAQWIAVNDDRPVTSAYAKEIGASMAYRLTTAFNKKTVAEQTLETLEKMGQATSSVWAKCVEVVDDPTPAVVSYAFKQGSKRSLIVLNMNTTESQELTVTFSGSAQGNVAQQYLLTSESASDANWLEGGEAAVVVDEQILNDFHSDKTITIPPCSVQSIVWEETSH